MSQRSMWTEPGPQSYPGEPRDHGAPLTLQGTSRAPAATEEMARGIYPTTHQVGSVFPCRALMTFPDSNLERSEFKDAGQVGKGS